LLKAELPYLADAQRLFAPLAERPWSMWLDSCGQQGELGRYDILVSEPHTTLLTRGDETVIRSPQGTKRSTDDPFSLLRQALDVDVECAQDSTVPFAGGAVGYFAYDLARRIVTLPQRALDDIGMPEMAIGIYDWALVCDHEQRACRLVSHGRRPETRQDWAELVARFRAAAQAEVTAREPLQSRSAVRANMDEAAYGEAFARIQHYLREGDCYQVNLAQRFSASVSGDPFQGYLALRSGNPAPFAAYLNTPHGQILSTSPERFLRLRDGQVETRPIKGTRPRSADPASDEALKQALQQSEKDRAENLMIVDLLRNDLSKNCRRNTVRVPQLFAVESYATVHHLVSVIQGQLREGSDALSLLRDGFPGGSITGAPKRRAMEIIEELEPCRRGVYCGSIGYIGFDGNMDTNIVIRTALHHEGKLYYSAGGGIVCDSNREQEYQETFDKAAAFFRCFDTPQA
jgi:para-aminobenzoate synthetase component 1